MASATFASPQEYIAQLDEPRRTQIQTIYDAIREAAPELEPWFVSGKIGFGKFSYKGRTCSGEWFKIGLASNKNTIMFATCAIVDGKNLAESYATKLPKASFGKSCINFRKWEDVDLEVLKEIARKSASVDYDCWVLG